MGIAERIKRVTRRLTDGQGERALERYQAKVEAVNALEPGLRQASATRLREEAERLMALARAGAPLDEMLLDVFALVREVARRAKTCQILVLQLYPSE